MLGQFDFEHYPSCCLPRGKPRLYAEFRSFGACPVGEDWSLGGVANSKCPSTGKPLGDQPIGCGLEIEVSSHIGVHRQFALSLRDPIIR